jgi:hypothetical protein
MMALQKPLPNWLLYKRNLFYEDIAEKKSSSQTFPRHPEAAIPDPAGKVHRCSSLRRKFIKEKKVARQKSSIQLAKQCILDNSFVSKTLL